MAADKDPLFPPIMATARENLWDAGALDSLAVDVGLGSCFQARSILNAFAKTRGAHGSVNQAGTLPTLFPVGWCP